MVGIITYSSIFRIGGGREVKGIPSTAVFKGKTTLVSDGIAGSRPYYTCIWIIVTIVRSEISKLNDKSKP